MNRRSQAPRLPAGFRSEGDEVLTRRDPDTGDVTLSRHNRKFGEWSKLRDELLTRIPAEYLDVLGNPRKSSAPTVPLPRCPACACSTGRQSAPS